MQKRYIQPFLSSDIKTLIIIKKMARKFEEKIDNNNKGKFLFLFVFFFLLLATSEDVMKLLDDDIDTVFKRVVSLDQSKCLPHLRSRFI